MLTLFVQLCLLVLVYYNGKGVCNVYDSDENTIHIPWEIMSEEIIGHGIIVGVNDAGISEWVSCSSR